MGAAVGTALGDTLDLAGAPFSGSGLVGFLLAVAALGIYALTSGGAGNDDDDSTPGGGLMQPVA